MHLEVLDERGKEIFFHLKKFKDFYLAGGTALALQLGHRVSDDFDLFSPKSISRSLLQKVKSVFPSKKITVSVNNRNELTFFVSGKKVTMLAYPFSVLLPYVNYDGIKFLSPKEIGATKAYTIGRRGSYKDYIDIYFLLRLRRATLKEIIMLASKKYKKDFHSRLFLEQLLYLDDVGDTNIKFLKKKIVKSELLDFFKKEIRKIKL